MQMKSNDFKYKIDIVGEEYYNMKKNVTKQKLNKIDIHTDSSSKDSIRCDKNKNKKINTKYKLLNFQNNFNQEENIYNQTTRNNTIDFNRTENNTNIYQKTNNSHSNFFLLTSDFQKINVSKIKCNFQCPYKQIIMNYEKLICELRDEIFSLKKFNYCLLTNNERKDDYISSLIKNNGNLWSDMNHISQNNHNQFKINNKKGIFNGIKNIKYNNTTSKINYKPQENKKSLNEAMEIVFPIIVKDEKNFDKLNLIHKNSKNVNRTESKISPNEKEINLFPHSEEKLINQIKKKSNNNVDKKEREKIEKFEDNDKLVKFNSSSNIENLKSINNFNNNQKNHNRLNSTSKHMTSHNLINFRDTFNISNLNNNESEIPKINEEKTFNKTSFAYRFVQQLLKKEGFNKTQVTNSNLNNSKNDNDKRHLNEEKNQQHNKINNDNKEKIKFTLYRRFLSPQLGNRKSLNHLTNSNSREVKKIRHYSPDKSFQKFNSSKKILNSCENNANLFSENNKFLDTKINLTQKGNGKDIGNDVHQKIEEKIIRKTVSFKQQLNNLNFNNVKQEIKNKEISIMNKTPTRIINIKSRDNHELKEQNNNKINSPPLKKKIKTETFNKDKNSQELKNFQNLNPNINNLVSHESDIKYFTDCNSHYYKITNLFKIIGKRNKEVKNQPSFLSLPDSVLKKMITSDLISEISKLTTKDEEFILCMRSLPDDQLQLFNGLISQLIYDYKYSIELIRRVKSCLQISVRLVNSMIMDDAIKSIIKNIVEVLECDKSYVYVYDPYTKMLLVHGGELMKNHTKINLDWGIVGWVFKKGIKQKIDDAHSDSRFDKEKDKFSSKKTKTLLYVPLFNEDGSVFGVIEAVNKKNGYFMNDDEELLEIFAKQIYSILKNSIQFDEYNSYISRLKLLHEFSLKLGKIKNKVEFTNTAESILMSLFSIGEARVYFIEKSETLNVNSIIEEEIKYYRISEVRKFKNNIGLLGKCLIKREIIITENIYENMDYNSLVDIEFGSSIITVPVFEFENQKDICLLAQFEYNIDKTKGNKIIGNHLDIINIFSQLAAMWIHNKGN